jgi:hypothetical protein
MSALESAVSDLKEAKAKVALLAKLKKFITVPIDRLFLFDEAWVMLAPMSMNEAIKVMKQVKAKKWILRGHKSTYNGSEDFSLISNIVLAETPIKLFIEINDIKEQHMKFRRTGSTSRSKAVGIDVLKTPPQFNYHKVCHGLFTVEYY